MVRYNPDGSLDESFGGTGIKTVEMGGRDTAYGVAVEPDGRILAAGTTGKHFALARFANPSADLSLSKTVSTASTVVGDELTYSLRIDNLGPSPSEEITLTDSLPSGVVYKSAGMTKGSCAENRGTLTRTIGTLARSHAAVVTITVEATRQGELTNTASVTTGTPDPDLSNNTATALTEVLAALPVVNFISPDCGPVSGGTPIKVVGTRLGEASEVRFGPVSVASSHFTVLSDQEIAMTTPPGGPGAVAVTVTTPQGSSSVSNRVVFTHPCVVPLPGPPPDVISPGVVNPISTNPASLAPPPGSGGLSPPTPGPVPHLAQAPSILQAPSSNPGAGFSVSPGAIPDGQAAAQSSVMPGPPQHR